MVAFDISVDGYTFSVISGSLEDGVELIFLDSIEYAWIQMNENEEWVEIDPETNLPVSSEYNEHLNAIGMQIEIYNHQNEE